ncbi:50S ribosomal protein L29 [Thalassoroseus pseudoceratinae]|uniref:50S ribosomal protein L29 n=1 Tax=Thalassoroseus pseudoceratinae TaxID=2713176 RepID=UPI0014223F5C|nr:50S ribosomal protein L29 [Thalassoroseus pseudoceratinae]
MSTAAELRDMSDEQLEFALKETREELFHLRFQSATERLDAPSQMKRLRREIARILTIQNERKLAGATASEES